MKALVLKDIYTIMKQMKIFLILILFSTVFANESMLGFAIIYSAMIPITALSFDEHSKWNNLALMLPYSAKDLVLSKYILGYLCMGATVIIAMIVSCVFSIIKGAPVQIDFFGEVLLITCIGTIFQAINLPIMFKAGVEKGRMIFLLMIVVICVGMLSLNNVAVENIVVASKDIQNVLGIFIIATIIINIVSMSIATKIYSKQLK